MKITTKNKSTIQFCFSNPHVLKQRTDINGITEQDMADIKNKLTKAYGDNWFSAFLALKVTTLNKAMGY